MSIKKMPVRLCIGCQESHSKKEMVRIVRSPEGDFSLDATGKKSGRGAYICPTVSCLEEAIKYKRLDKSFKMSIDAAVYENLQKEFEEIARTKIN